MRKRRTSLKDIAEKAGVSIALVSYVVNGKEHRAGPVMAKKIKTIAQELNYQPNYVAKSLRSGKTQTLGLIIADISNPFFANIARVIEDEAKHKGYTVIIGSSDENEQKSRDLMEVFLHRQVDGLIIVSSEGTEKHLSYLQQQQVPFILLDRHFPDIVTDFVVTDNYDASYQATEHLIKNGYTRIGMIAYEPIMFHMQERIRGYRTVLAMHGLSTNLVYNVIFKETASQVRKAIDELLKPPQSVDALIFATYGLAIAGLKYLNEQKVKVPEQVAIVSFGQAEGLDLYYCPISYIEQPLELLGKTSVEILIEKLQSTSIGCKQLYMTAKLIERNSSIKKKQGHL